MGQVKINNLDIQVGATSICSNIMLTIPKKTVLTVAGDMDSGRIELIDAVVGNIIPTNGSIQVDDEEVTKMPPHQRKFVQIGSDWGLFPHLSVRGNLSLGLKYQKLEKGEGEERIEKILQQTGLLEKQNLPPTRLDPQDQLRVVLGRAAAIQPSLLVLTDPFLHFDTFGKRQLGGVFRELQQTFGFSALISTRNALDTMGVSDQLAIMSKGYIEQSGPTREVYDFPSNLLVARMTGEINILPGQVVMGGDFYMFTTKVGGINLRSKEKLRIETQVEILIRPEHTRIVPLGKTADARNVFSAKIRRIDFMAGFEYVELVTEDNTPFYAVHNPEHGFQAGDDIDVILTREDYTIIKKQ